MLDVLITEWALRSYLNIVHAGLMRRDEYLSVVRPDVERLEAFPVDPKFALAGFWGPLCAMRTTRRATRWIGDSA
jgi:hypothetical protein